MTASTWQGGAWLGALVGIVEALAIVRYDWVQGDPTPDRMLTAAAWAVAIVALDAAGGALLGALSRGRWWLLALLWAGLVLGTRAWTGDRFVWWSLSCAPAALAVAALLPRWPRLTGLLAVALALPALWGRVPVYTTPPAEQVTLWLTGGLIAVGLGALPRPGSRAPRPHGLLTAGLCVAAMLALALPGPGAHVLAVPPGPPAPGTKNLVYILVDTLRADHVEPYGRHTPGTARLAAEGTTFSDVTTVIPKTTQSVAAQQTGRYPVFNGVRVLSDRLAADQQTLAETLSSAGFDTAAIVHNGWIMRGRGFEQGFEQFWSFFELERAYGPARLTGLVTALDTLSLRRIRAFDGNTDAEVATDRAIAWLEERGDQPFYLYLHYFDPHWPYRPPGVDAECVVNNIKQAKWSRGQMIFANPLPDAENQRAIELYGQEVDHNDDQVGRLLDWLDQAGLAEDTVVVFTSDHGHHLGEHDYWYHHGELLYQPGVQIPLIVRAPGGLPPGQVDDRPVRSIDLMPTVLGLLGIEGPEGMDGVDLQLQAPGPAFLETDISYFRWNKRRLVPGIVGKVRGLRDGRWKLHYTPAKGGGLFELYDLVTDPQELHDLSEDPARRELLARLIQQMAAYIPGDEREALAGLGNALDGSAPASQPASGRREASPVREPELDANERAMLEALGYVDSEP